MVTARTVYQITEDGRLELAVQRDAALEVVFGSAGPLSVVLLFAAGTDPAELSERLEAELRWHEEFGRQHAAGVAGMAERLVPVRTVPVRSVGGASGDRK